MGLFDDLSQFLEHRLDEFLKNNPHLELQALAEKLHEQEFETRRLLTDLKARAKEVENDILKTAQEIQRWHIRIEKAKAADRLDLTEPAQEHEAGLLRQGNQKWGQMEILRERIKQTEELQLKIQARRQEVQAELNVVRETSKYQTEQTWSNWDQYASQEVPPISDPLEQRFRKWETQQELDDLKRQMGDRNG
jgi:uncharacterized protein (TIGR04376 family)